MHTALVYFDHFNDDRSVYLADGADARIQKERDTAVRLEGVVDDLRERIAELEAQVKSLNAEADSDALRARATIRELEAERDAAREEVIALQFRVDQQRILAGFGDTDLRLARSQRDDAYKVLRRIAGYRLAQFKGPFDMALACVEEAREMFPQEDDTHG
jgi:hypothetical protein